MPLFNILYIEITTLRRAHIGTYPLIFDEKPRRGESQQTIK